MKGPLSFGSSQRLQLLPDPRSGSAYIAWSRSFAGGGEPSQGWHAGCRENNPRVVLPACSVDFHTQAADAARQLNIADVDRLLKAVYDIMAPKGVAALPSSLSSQDVLW